MELFTWCRGGKRSFLSKTLPTKQGFERWRDLAIIWPKVRALDFQSSNHRLFLLPPVTTWRSPSSYINFGVLPSSCDHPQPSFLTFSSPKLVNSNLPLPPAKMRSTNHSFNSSPSSAKPPISSPCAACKILRRRCSDQCTLKPYFPPSEPQKFITVHRIFGASNIVRLLKVGVLHIFQAESMCVYMYTCKLKISFFRAKL